jgi:hypothetical protein
MPDPRPPAAAPASRQEPMPSATDEGSALAAPELSAAGLPPADGSAAIDDRTEQRSDLKGGNGFRAGGGLGLADVLQVLSLVVAPTTFVTALLYYFGWVSTGAEFGNFGLAQSLLGLSTTDYVLRSVAPMFWPLSLLVMVVIFGFLLHLALMRTLPRSSALAQRWVPIAIGLVGLIFLWQGVAVPFEIPRAVADYGFTPPQIFLAAGIALTSYAGYLWDRLRVPAAQRRPWVATSPWAARGLVVFPILLVLLFIFWAVSDYAAAYGRTHAKEVEGKLDERSSVTVYSAKRLYIDDSADSGSGSGVHEEPLPEGDGAYRYRYQGLRLLGRSNDRYFLLPGNWSPGHPVTIVLLDSDTIRVELRRGIQR